jgi:hypothetical protein
VRHDEANRNTPHLVALELNSRQAGRAGQGRVHGDQYRAAHSALKDAPDGMDARVIGQ